MFIGTRYARTNSLGLRRYTEGEKKDWKVHACIREWECVCACLGMCVKSGKCEMRERDRSNALGEEISSVVDIMYCRRQHSSWDSTVYNVHSACWISYSLSPHNVCTFNTWASLRSPRFFFVMVLFARSAFVRAGRANNKHFLVGAGFTAMWLASGSL